MVDYMLWPWFERLPVLSEAGFEFNADGNFPKLAAWIEAMKSDESVQKVQIPTEISKKFMETHRQGTPEYDI
jgi:glutathione S-transferase